MPKSEPLKTLLTLKADPGKTLTVKLPKLEGKVTVYMRFLTTEQDHPALKETSNEEVWFDSNLPMVKLTDGSDGVMVPPVVAAQCNEKRQLEIAYGYEKKKEKKPKPKK